VFTLGEFLLVKILGFALATAVLLDATVLRLALGSGAHPTHSHAKTAPTAAQEIRGGSVADSPVTPHSSPVGCGR